MSLPTPVTLSEIKSIIVKLVNIPDPTINPTIWFGDNEDANKPMANVAEEYSKRPKIPLNRGPESGSPKI